MLSHLDQILNYHQLPFLNGFGGWGGGNHRVVNHELELNVEGFM